VVSSVGPHSQIRQAEGCLEVRRNQQKQVEGCLEAHRNQRRQVEVCLEVHHNQHRQAASLAHQPRNQHSQADCSVDLNRAVACLEAPIRSQPSQEACSGEELHNRHSQEAYLEVDHHNQGGREVYLVTLPRQDKQVGHLHHGLPKLHPSSDLLNRHSSQAPLGIRRRVLLH
jgi:hypothetical protein